MKMVVFRADRRRQGHGGRILRYAKSRKYDGLNVGSKTADEPLKHGETQFFVSGQKAEKRGKENGKMFGFNRNGQHTGISRGKRQPQISTL